MKLKFILILLLYSSVLLAEELPQDLIYPEYFQKNDLVTAKNIGEELNFRRWRYYYNNRMDRDYQKCWKMQRRLMKAIDNMKMENVKIPVITNEIACGEKSPIAQYRTLSVSKAFSNCNFKSYGNLNDGSGVVYCSIHGTDGDIKSPFAQKHKYEFKKNRPFLNSVDVLEFLLFLPGFLIFILNTFIMSKLL